MSNIGVGTATRTTNGASSSGANRPSSGFEFPNLKPNPLDEYASYTPLWTLAALTPTQLSNPLSYRNKSNEGNIANVVFSSAGRFGNQRTLIDAGGVYNDVDYGGFPLLNSPEYFVDNFKMRSIIVPTADTGNTNSVNYSFDIFEPYSMGNFLKSLQTAAINAGYINYLMAPYLLKLEFNGWDAENYLHPARIDRLPRYFVIRFQNIKFEVTEAGSTYQCKAIPFPHQAFSNIVNTILTDVNISGSTVKEILADGPNSLAVALDQHQTRLKQAGKIGEKDQYIFLFPDADGNRAFNTNRGSNIIGSASMGFTPTSPGVYPFSRASDVFENGKVNRDKVTIDPATRSMMFAQGQSLTSIIDTVIGTSQFALKALDAVKQKDDGSLEWFRVEPIITLGKFDVARNDYAKIIAFKISPYLLHSSVFQTPAALGYGYQNLKKSIVKKYSYIYSGENKDITKFDLRFDTTFYTAITPGFIEESKNSDPATGANAPEAKPKTNIAPSDTSAVGALFAATGKPRIAYDGSIVPDRQGGVDAVSVATAVARDMQNAIKSGNTDLLRLEVEILGDPYYLADSGISNYFSPPAYPNAMINEDGSMSYDTREIAVYFSFRNPIDINENTQMYDFPGSTYESIFSGLYRVLRVESNISGGVFKQNLTCARLPGQPEDYDRDVKPPAATKTSAVNTAGAADNADIANIEYADGSGVTVRPVAPPPEIIGTPLN